MKRRHAATGAAKPHLPGDQPLKDKTARMIRVNHAGEFGAQRIYAGQLTVLNETPSGAVIRHMAAQEDEHLAAFDRLVTARAVRPTALHPLWSMAGYALGYVTAKLGAEAAMACTVAVEEVIDAHYAAQLQELSTDDPELTRLIAKFRADENEHEATARQHGAETAKHYEALRRLVRLGSKTAIWLSERI